MAKKKRKSPLKQKDQYDLIMFASQTLINSHKMSYKDHDYRKCMKSRVDSAIDSIDPKIMKSITKSDEPMSGFLEHIKLTPLYKKRRKEALSNYMPEYSKRFKDAYQDIEIESIILDMNQTPSPATSHILTKCSVETHCDDIITAVALTILDELKRTDNIDIIIPYLSKLDPSKFKTDIALLNMQDCVFPTETINAMRTLIMYRDIEKTEYPLYNEKTCSRVYVKPDETSLPDENNFTFRELMNFIWSLLDKSTIEKAENVFREKHFEVVKNCIDYNKDIYKTTIDNVKRYMQACKKLKELENNADKHISNLSHEEKIKITLNIGVASPLFTDPNTYAIKNLKNEMHIAHEEVLSTHEDCVNTRNEYLERMGRFVKSHYNADYINAKNTIFDAPTLEIDNPFELLLGYFSLVEKNDDIAWILEPTGLIIHTALNALPFNYYDNYERIYAKQNKNPIAANDDNVLSVTVSDHTSSTNDQDLAEMARKFYKKNYNDHILWKLDDLEINKNTNYVHKNIAQLLCILSAMMPLRDMSVFNNAHTEDLINSGLSPETAGVIHYAIEAQCATFNKNRYALIHDSDKTDVNALIAENESYLKKLKSLKNTEYKATRKAKDLEEKIEELNAKLEAKNKELAQLRDLLYNMQTENSETETENIEQIDISNYTINHKTTIFGGHPTWLKTMKTIFKDSKKITFIGPNDNYDLNRFKNSEVVWFQANAIPHCEFYKIIDALRTHGIRVEYFTYASAKKCAQQLCECDAKMTTESEN